MYKKQVFLLKLPSTILLMFMVLSCSNKQELPPLPSGAQAISLLGDTLQTPVMVVDNYDELNDKLIEAVMDYRADPENAEFIIWLGRRTAYLGEYREAVEIFTEGVGKHPEDPRMYRHRGHRYFTLRLFEMAKKDFENAEKLMKKNPDRIELDGLPNPMDIPTSTLKSNVWYHLGLTHYVKGNYSEAAETYKKALDLDLTDDMRIALLYWYYMSLRRDGRDIEAGALLDDVTAEINLIENTVYLNLLLVFKGVFEPGHLLESDTGALENATLGYGIGNWHFINGRETRAFDIWQTIYDTGQWAAFGYIAAETELARKNLIDESTRK